MRHRLTLEVNHPPACTRSSLIFSLSRWNVYLDSILWEACRCDGICWLVVSLRTRAAIMMDVWIMDCHPLSLSFPKTNTHLSKSFLKHTHKPHRRSCLANHTLFQFQSVIQSLSLALFVLGICVASRLYFFNRQPTPQLEQLHSLPQQGLQTNNNNNSRNSMILTVFPSHPLVIPGRIAAFAVACILVHGSLFRSRSSPFFQEPSASTMKITSTTTTTNHHDSQLRPSSSTTNTRHLVVKSLPPRRQQQPPKDKEHSSNAVTVKILLESLCIDCQHFVLNELVPTYHALSYLQDVEWQFIVYGNAQLDLNTQSVTCQHGAGECSTNSLLQCALHQFPEPSRYLPFVACVYQTLPMGHADEPFPPASFAECARQAALPWSMIQACHENPLEAWDLQVQASYQTPSYHDHVPWIEINGQYVSETTSLLQAICDAFSTTHQGPLPCDNDTGTGTVALARQ